MTANELIAGHGEKDKTIESKEECANFDHGRVLSKRLQWAFAKRTTFRFSNGNKNYEK